MKGKILGVIAAVLLAGPVVANAGVVYQYTGLDFTNFASSPWSTSDNVSGVLSLSSPLPVNLAAGTNQNSRVTTFAFSDGVRSFTEGSHPNFLFTFGTNASGDITSWYFQFVDSGGLLLTSQNDASFRGDSVGLNNSKFAESPGAGRWTRVPEPATLALLGLGLAGVGFSAARRRAN